MAEEMFEDGLVPYHVPSLSEPCMTYYKIFGDLNSGHTPTVVVHGGPGSAHNYMLPFAVLWQQAKTPVIFFDAIGCAKSTHYRDRLGDHAFWTMDLFAQQLSSLIDALHLRGPGKPGFHLLGHSFGGMISSYYATSQPEGLQKLVIANSPASTDLWQTSCRVCWKELSAEALQAADEAQRTGDCDTQSYKDAEILLRRNYWCRARPFPPKEVEYTNFCQKDDPTSRVSLYGPGYAVQTGSLRGWNCFAALKNITAPTFIYNGEFDPARDEAIAPYEDNIPGSRRVTLPNASHMSHLDNPELRETVMNLVTTFLLE